MRGEATQIAVLEERHSRPAQSEQPTRIALPVTADLAAYVMALKECADRHGGIPTHSYRNVSLNPPYFECVATIGGHVFEVGAKSRNLRVT